MLSDFGYLGLLSLQKQSHTTAVGEKNLLFLRKFLWRNTQANVHNVQYADLPPNPPLNYQQQLPPLLYPPEHHDQKLDFIV